MLLLKSCYKKFNEKKVHIISDEKGSIQNFLRKKAIIKKQKNRTNQKMFKCSQFNNSFLY